MRVGSYSAVLWCATLLLFLRHMPGISHQDREAVVDYRERVTLVSACLASPSFPMAALLRCTLVSRCAAA